MIKPFFTEREQKSWAEKKKRANKELPTDNSRMDSFYRLQEVRNQLKGEKLRRILSRPEDVAHILLVALDQRKKAFLSESVFYESYEKQIQKADTEKNRRILWTTLEALKHIPLSWGKTATVRFFRANGVQGKEPYCNRVGSNLFGKEQGWTARDATSFVGSFYNGILGEAFMYDMSLDPYSEEARSLEKDGGNRWAQTSKERNEEFIEAIQEILKEKGLGSEISITSPKKTTFEAGDFISKRTAKDLPKGSVFEWKRKGKTFTGVFVKKVGSGYEVQPIVEGKVFAPKSSSSHIFEEALFKGTVKDFDLESLESIEIKTWNPYTL